MINKELLHNLYEYKNGNLYYKKIIFGNTKRKIGDLAGYVTNEGYISVKVNKTTYLVHRLIYLMHYGVMPRQIDHIDGNPANNKIENLRAVTQSENQWNTDRACNSVSFHKASKKWRDRIKINNKEIYLGVFSDIEQARQVKQEAARRRWGCR